MQKTTLKLNRMALVGLFTLLLAMGCLSACGSTARTTYRNPVAAPQQSPTVECDEGCRALRRLQPTYDCDEGARALARLSITAYCRNV